MQDLYLSCSINSSWSGTISLGWGLLKLWSLFSPLGKSFYLAKIHVRLLKSCSYLTGVAAAKLRRPLSNMYMI